VIIPTRNGAQLVRRCVESIVAKTTYAPLEILLVDNDSDEPVSVGYFAELERSGTVRMLGYGGRFNYSAINNHAVGFAHGDVLALLNNDTEVIDGVWLTELVSYATMPSIGAVGAKLLYPDGTIQHAGIVMGLHGSVGHGQRRTPGDSSGYGGSLAVAREVTAVTGACLALRKEVFQEVGGLDEQNLPVTFNDVDLCLKLRARGYRNIWTPHAVLYHHEAATRGPDASGESAARYRREFELMRTRWGAQLEQDPYYSPNLSLAGDDNRLAFPPRCSAPWRMDSTPIPTRSNRHHGHAPHK
jgi:GT2 family glycosyltransferase